MALRRGDIRLEATRPRYDEAGDLVAIESEISVAIIDDSSGEDVILARIRETVNVFESMNAAEKAGANQTLGRVRDLAETSPDAIIGP
jgi:hypothetical protein